MFDNFIEWLCKEKYQITLTILAAIVPMCITFTFNDTSDEFNVNLHNNVQCKYKKCSCSNQVELSKCFCECHRVDANCHDLKQFVSKWTISKRYNYALQTVFIFITLFILVYNKRIIYKDLKYSYSIKAYLIRKCNVKIKDRETVNNKFAIIEETTKQFFRVWILVWMMWFALYFGELIFSLIAIPVQSGLNKNIAEIIYSQFFDFLTSSTVFVIYLILTNVTVNIKHRKKYDESIWWGIIGWIMCFTIFVICICLEISLQKSSNVQMLTSVFLSVLSAISFLLVLGKMNSLYLQIPQLFLIVLYIYGIVQCYLPIENIDTYEISIYSNFFIPYITLFGKVILMLTLCWIVYKKRFIYYIIHQTILVDDNITMLNELNRR